MDEYEGLRRFGREVDKLAGKMRETRASSEVEKMKCGPDGREKASYESLHGATGIERLRGLTEFWRANRLDDIVEQIEREHGCDSDAIENVRLIVGRVITDMERHVSGVEGMEDSPVARWARELREALGGKGRDHAEDVSVSAYDLLPQEDRDAIAWVREHGGVEHVRSQWDYLSGRANHADHVDRQIAKRQRQIEESHAALRRRNERIAELEREVGHQQDVGAGRLERIGELVDENKGLRARVENQRASLDGLTAAIGEMRPRLMPEGMEWPVFEDGEPVRIGDEVDFGGDGGAASSVELQDDGHFVIHACDGAGDYSHRNFRPGEHVKRPAPKVLAADGEPLEVGQTVWETDAETDTPLTVVDVSSDLVRCEYTWKDGKTYRPCYPPSALAHTKPEIDTWQCIEDDAGCTATKYNERRGTIFTTKQQVARDLVSRCRALAERERGER